MKSARWLSYLLSAAMMIGLIPFQALAAENANNNQNNQPVSVEPWTYEAGASHSLFSREEVLYSVAEAASSEAVSDIVEVTVNAVNRSTNKKETIEGAEAYLYVGSRLVDSDTTDSNGVAELSMKGLSIEERQNATVSAKKIVSRGKAIDGTARDALFNKFPKDENGDYYRYTLELHSETIDENGNWLGEDVPVGKESNKVDMVFAIDATGSMGGEINNVKDNIASFAENLIASGLDIRFSIIEYRDINISGEETIVHTYAGSHWMTSIEGVTSALGNIVVDGGGDGPETPLDALGYAANNGLMNWRSDAHRFAFVLTDAGYHNTNNHGYSGMADMVDTLAEMGIVTSVITSSSYKATYSTLYEGTGGIYANINSSSFDEEMMNLSNSIIASVTREMTLTLSEPRMLVNLAVCYYANDASSQSGQYKTGLKQTLDKFADIMAESTDGHVLLDKVILFSTKNRTDFYNTSKEASMADIRIETKVEDPDSDGTNATIGSNAYVAGFYSDNTVALNRDNNKFHDLPDLGELLKRNSFYRIQLGGTTWSWEVTFTSADDQTGYASTIMHEAGHYLLALYDEYLDAEGRYWSDGTKNTGPWPQPYFGPDDDTLRGGYGLMDNHHYGDRELTKANIDYSYMTNGFSLAHISLHTRQSHLNNGSCEDSLATLLTDPEFRTFNMKSSISSSDFDLGDVKGVYSKVTGSSDRTAKYSYAGLSESDYISLPNTSGGGGDGSFGGGGGGGRTRSLMTLAETEPVFSSDSVAEAAFSGGADSVSLSIQQETGKTYEVSIMKSGDESFQVVNMTDGQAVLPITKGEVAEVRVTVTSDDIAQYNTYFIDRSEETEEGYLYTSADNAVMAYVLTDEEESYTFVADNTGYTNGDFRSVNQATRISSDNGVGFDSGEIYSVASYLAEIDYTTLSWFKYADGKWTQLDTDYSEEENMNIGARADLDGEGLYVLMAKAAPAGNVLPAENLSYTQSTDWDAVVTLSFDDPNTNSKYYNVYYSENEFTDKNAEGVVVRSFDASSTDLILDLLERGRTVYAGVEIVLEDGSRSELSDIVLVGGEADSDGDGIPDWYCDKYLLWGKDGENKDIANSDDDGDGLTNLEEYQGGSDPTNPNDPKHTTNVPAESVSVSESKVTLLKGKTADVTATVLPENATNRNVRWFSEDEAIATVSVTDGVCTITAVAPGETTVYAVSLDGGYPAGVAVIVEDHTHSGGKAACNAKAVCGICGEEYGDLDPANHSGGTEVRDAVKPTYTKKGYTGDTYCLGCGKMIKEGKPIPKKTQDIPVTPENPFLDVPAGSYYEEPVLWAVEKGITTGLTATTFGPNASCTRAQAVTFLWRAAGCPAPVSNDMPFSDVANDAYYYDAVLWAVENGITTGTSANTFSPNANCVRGQIVTFLWRAQGNPDVDGVNPFVDVASDAYYAKAVLWAVRNGVTTGTSATTFSSDMDCTRAQIVTFLFRTYN